MIKQVGNKFQLVSQKTGKVLGTHPSKAKAEAQEKAIELSQARKDGHDIPKD